MTFRRRRRGWVFIDALVGVLLVAAVAAVLVTAFVRVSRARDRMAQMHRDLTALQASLAAGGPLPPGAAERPAGEGWTRVSLGRAELYVPAGGPR